MDFKHVKQGHSCVLVKDVANNYKELLASNDKTMEDALIEGNIFLERLTITTEQLDRDAENAKKKLVKEKHSWRRKSLKCWIKKPKVFVRK